MVCRRQNLREIGIDEFLFALQCQGFDDYLKNKDKMILKIRVLKSINIPFYPGVAIRDIQK